MPDHTTSTLAVALAKAPEWVRQELASPERSVRQRAEEALAAMLAAALHASPEASTAELDAEEWLTG